MDGGDYAGDCPFDVCDHPAGELSRYFSEYSAWMVRLLRMVGRLEGTKRWPPRKGTPWSFSESAVEALKDDPGYQMFRARNAWANSPEGREQRAVARELAAAEWTLRVNGWDNPEHEYTYQVCPSNGW